MDGQAVKRTLASLVPSFLRAGSRPRAVVSVMRHLLVDYGWYRSLKEQACVDRSGQPIPWFTYPCIDYLRQLDCREKTVFEWGAGFSTMFWSDWAKSVTSIETDPIWREKVVRAAGSNATVLMSGTGIPDYCGAIEKFDGFDIIVIDGIGESRFACAEIAPAKLNRGGMIILDNSDLWPKTAAALKRANLIQVDFAGFAPMSNHCTTTSIFFSREFDFPSRFDEQPRRSVGQTMQPWLVEDGRLAEPGLPAIAAHGRVRYGGGDCPQSAE